MAERNSGQVFSHFLRPVRINTRLGHEFQRNNDRAAPNGFHEFDEPSLLRGPRNERNMPLGSRPYLEIVEPSLSRPQHVALPRHNWPTVESFMAVDSIFEGPYCNCYQDEKKAKDCTCGETDTEFEWVWDNRCLSRCLELHNGNRDALFHKQYSGGTGVAKGSIDISKNQHFWEIKMISPVYGTDMMVGIGTENLDVSRQTQIFCSILGSSPESWGLSYTGMFYHKGTSYFYTSRFGQGTIIGVHLDMWHGTLSFYKNRRFLGIAYRGLTGDKKLYPMVSSTAARSKMRIITSKSFGSSLTYLCVLALRKMAPPDKDVLDVIKVPPGLTKYLQTHLYWLLAPTEKANSNRKPSDYCSACSKKNRMSTKQVCAEEHFFLNQTVDLSVFVDHEEGSSNSASSSGSGSQASGLTSNDQLAHNSNKRKLDENEGSEEV